MQATFQKQDRRTEATLLVAFELSAKKWKLALGSPKRRKPSIYEIDAGDFTALQKRIDRVREKLKLPENCKVLSCYEAGRDGFWIHRALTDKKIENIIVDPASIEVNRRARRAKSDGIDVRMLYNRLGRYSAGEEDVWSVVVVPEINEEDCRRPSRELERLTKEATQHSSRIRSLLALHGIKMKRVDDPKFVTRLETTTTGNGIPLPKHLKNELVRENARIQMVKNQIREIEEEMKKKRKMSKAPDRFTETAANLERFRGIGLKISTKLSYEMFAWRHFKNRRNVGAFAGLCPTPYDSGETEREQGISKTGNPRVRYIAVEMAWLWVRWQPDSEITKWFQRRFGDGGKRMRKIGIVAVARKLLIALWRFLEFGEVPEGAILVP